MRNNTFKLCSFLMVVFFVPSLFAGPKARKAARHRQHNEEQRIRQGVQSGELTKDEAKDLQKEQHEIRKARKEAVEDGKVTKEESKEIKEMQENASKNIYEEKHDTEKRQ